MNIFATRLTLRAIVAAIVSFPIGLFAGEWIFLGPIDSVKLRTSLRVIRSGGEAVVLDKPFDPWDFLLNSTRMHAVYIFAAAASIAAFLVVEQRRLFLLKHSKKSAER